MARRKKAGKRKKAAEPELPLFADLPLRPVEDQATAPPEPAPVGGTTPESASEEAPGSADGRSSTQTDLFASIGDPPPVEAPAPRPVEIAPTTAPATTGPPTSHSHPTRTTKTSSTPPPR